MLRFLAAVLAVGAISCSPPAIEYPVPPQRALPASEPDIVTLLAVNDPVAPRHVVQDIMLGDKPEEWVWTNQKPRFWTAVNGNEGWLFEARFTVPGVVLERLHKVTLTFSVNDHPLGSRTYDKDGGYVFTAAVPPALLTAEPEHVVFGFDVDPVYIAEGDGNKLGVLLSAMGLRKAEKP